MTDESPPDPLEAAAQWADGDARVGLATVIRTWGSAPRQPGAQMCLGPAGEVVGSVSGGCVEGAVIQRIRSLLESGGHDLLSFGVTDEEAWEVGLACGGQVDVLAEVVSDDSWLGRVLDALEAGRATVVAVDLASGERTVLHPLDDPVAEDGATPAGGPEGDAGGGQLAAARRAVLADRSTVWEDEGRSWFLHVFNPPVRVVIVGAVHIAQPLAVMARHAGFDVVVIDPRSAFATRERFPGTRLVRAWPEEALSGLEIDHRTAIVTVTHDPKLDDPALRTALRSRAFYVGALGSRRTHAKRVTRLRESGFSDEEIDRIDAPVGLDIGARTPGEIAASVLAGIIGELRTRTD